MTKRISIFGATGSIGDSTLDIIRKSPKNAFKILGLSANKNYKKLAQNAIEFGVQLAVISDQTKYNDLKEALAGTGIKAAAGISGMLEICSLKNDLVVAAIVGIAGLLTTYQSLKNGVNVALANKESLVCAGKIIKGVCAKTGAKIIPVDSEHNAIFQVLDAQNQEAVSKIILTASGGPFRKYSQQELELVTTEAALKHPNWVMGQKVTIDSASLFNKGLETIEAHYLFDIAPDDIEVVIHPESIIHSMVNYRDGSTLAQLGEHDMKVPITHALYWPKRYSEHTQIVNNLDFFTLKQLNFERPDIAKFPSLTMCMDAIKIGGSAPIALNSANEIAVEMFLNKAIGFTDIFKIVQRTLANYQHHDVESIDDVIALDQQFRKMASFRN